MRSIRSSRSESEKKGEVTSIRLNKSQHERIKEQAKAKGMTVSNYIITAAVNGGSTVTPEMLVKMQNLANVACDAVKESAPEKVDLMQKEMNAIWQELA